MDCVAWYWRLFLSKRWMGALAVSDHIAFSFILGPPSYWLPPSSDTVTYYWAEHVSEIIFMGVWKTVETLGE
jgi:hypothetical protein